jgi:hypothetical protein
MYVFSWKEWPYCVQCLFNINFSDKISHLNVGSMADITSFMYVTSDPLIISDTASAYCKLIFLPELLQFERDFFLNSSHNAIHLYLWSETRNIASCSRFHENFNFLVLCNYQEDIVVMFKCQILLWVSFSPSTACSTLTEQVLYVRQPFIISSVVFKTSHCSVLQLLTICPRGSARAQEAVVCLAISLWIL